MAKNLLEGLFSDMKALNEEEFNLTRNDSIEVNDDVQDDVSIEVVADPEFEEHQDSPKDYVGKNVIYCNICMRPFFSDEDVNDAMTCPMCAAESVDLIKVGTVVSDEAPVTDETEPAPEADETEPVAPEATEGEDDEIKESVNINVNTDTSTVTVDTDDADVNVNDEGGRVVDPVAPIVPEVEPETEPDVVDDMELEYEEESFNKLFTKFLTDNYSNVKTFNLVEAKQVGESLVLEGVITFNNATTRAVKITTDALSLTEGTTKCKAACPLFGKSKAFVIEHVVKENKVSASKLSYRYKTRANNESYNVVGMVKLDD